MSVNPLLLLMQQRIKQHVEATERGEVAGRAVGDIPLVGGLLTSGSSKGNTNPLSVVNLLNSAGLAGEGLVSGAKATTAAALLGANRAARLPGGDRISDAIPLLYLADKLNYDVAAAQAAEQYQRNQAAPTGYERLREANEAGAKGHEVQVGALNEAADLRNYLPVVGQMGKLGRIAEIARGADRLQGLPFEAAGRGAGRALRPVLHLLAEQRAAREGAGAAATGLPAPPLDLDALLRERRAGNPLPLAPTIGEFGRYAKREGLPTRASLPREASPLAPDNFSILRAAKALGEQAPSPQAALPEPPVATPRRKPYPTKVSPLNDRVAAIMAGRTASTPVTPDPAEALRELLLSGDNGRGMIYPPESPDFYARRLGLDPEAVPGLLRRMEGEGVVSRIGPDQSLVVNRPRETPVRATNADPRLLRALADVDPTIVPDDALSMADEAAAIEANQGVRQLLPRPEATDLPAVGGAASLAPDEIDGLLSIAYPTETAIGHAIAKYPDPTDLANRAIERITTTPNLTRELGERYPEVARRIALLDLPGESAMANGAANAGRPSLGFETPDGRYTPVVDIDRALTIDDEFRQVLPDEPSPTLTVRDEHPVSRPGARTVPGAAAPPDPTLEYAKALGTAIQRGGGNLADFLSATRGRRYLSATGRPDEAIEQLSAGARRAGLDEATITTIREKFQPRTQGGDLAAGGGGMGIIAPLAPFGRTAAGAALGGATGALAGALADDEDRGRGALTGAGIGAAAGANLGGVSPEIAAEARKIGPAIASRFRDTALDPGIWEEGVARGIQDQIESQGNKGVRGGKAAWDAFWRRQRSQVVNTLKQIPQDAFTQLITRMGIAGREFGIDDSDIRRMAGVLRRERQVGGASSLTNPNPVNARLLALGNKNAVSKSQEYFGLDYGTSLAGEGAEFKGGGRAAAGALIGALNGAARLNPLAVAYGAARGYVAPFVDGTIRYVNGIQHDAFRYAMVEKGLDREIPKVAAAFLDDLDRGGVDTTSLRAGGGYFSADEVRRVAGDDAAKRWDWLQETTVRRVGDRVAFLAGDFRDKLAKDYGGRVTRFDRARAHVEAGIGRYVPFVRWQMRYAPVLAEIAARNPLATYYAVKGTVAGVEDARENHLKPYQAGTIPVTTETPVLGGLARARLGGQAGTVRLDPLGAINPYGAGSFVADELPADATGYQRATNAAARIGFSPAPPIQATAYAAGWDYKAPSALSRTAGLEGLADLPPVLARAILQGMGQHQLAAAVPELPTLPGGGEALARAREIVTGRNATAYDPTTRRYAELVLARTGKPLAHPDNRAYLEAVGAANEPLWQLATVQQRLGGAAGNATGMLSPVSVTGQTREAVGAQAAGKPPFTIGQIIDAPTEAIRKQMEAANAAAIEADPRLGTYQSISGGGRTHALEEDWKRRNQGLKRIAPALYAERLEAYKKSIR